jgi:hypothetical protein
MARDDVVGVKVMNTGGHRGRNVPVTFGQPFRPGDIPKSMTLGARLKNGKTVPIQLDKKAANPDGSLRHGVITLELPDLKAGAADVVQLYTKKPAKPAPALSIHDLPKKLNAMVNLNIDGDVYTASTAKLSKKGKVKRWLSGPLVDDWIVSGPFTDSKGKTNPHLLAQFSVRYYPQAHTGRISVTVENDWTYVPDPQEITYDAQIEIAGHAVYTRKDLHHYWNTRWRKVFWWPKNPGLFVQHDIDYLRATHAISYYDPSLKISGHAIAKLYRRFKRSDTAPEGSSIVTKYMGATGGRGDIGPLPRWACLYVLSMDPRAKEVTWRTADLAGSWPIHWRDKKTGLPISLKNHPRLSVHQNLRYKTSAAVAKPKHWPYRHGIKNRLRPDDSHEPALAYIPYLLGGDYYYLEELEFWAAYNPLYTSPEYRGYSKGLLKWLQIRGQAWTLRTLARTAWVAPDDDPLKDTFLSELKANLDWYDKHYANNPHANKLGIVLHYTPSDYFKGLGQAPWQDDFFTWAISYIEELGFKRAAPMARWKGKFPVGRMTAPGFCWIQGSAYALKLRNSRSSPLYDSFAQVWSNSVGKKKKSVKCGSQAMANLYGKHPGQYKAGDMAGYPWSPQGFPSNMQPALAAAVDQGVPHAKEAWRIFMQRTTKPDYSGYPNWDIVPRPK